MASNKRIVSTTDFFNSDDSSDDEQPVATKSGNKKKLSYSPAVLSKVALYGSNCLPVVRPSTSTLAKSPLSLPMTPDTDISFEISPSSSKLKTTPHGGGQEEEEEDTPVVMPDGNQDLKKMVKVLMEQNKKILDRLGKLETEDDVDGKKKNKIIVPNDLRAHLRLAYENGPKQNLNPWNVENGVGPYHEDNKKMTQYMTNFVRGLHRILPNLDAVINKAIKTYFVSQLRKKLRKENDPDRNKKTNQKQRRVHKAARRRKALLQVDDGLISPKQKKDFILAIVPDMMSSEEESSDEQESRYFKVHTPSWRTKKFQKLVGTLDKTHLDQCSKRAKEQMAPRQPGSPSKRQPPKSLKFGYDLFVDKGT